MSHNSIKFTFFGSSEFSIYVLDELKLHKILPSLIITLPDKPQGRKLVLTPNVVKIWGEQNNIPVLTPASLKNSDFTLMLTTNCYDLFLVASYGKIIPRDIFEIPAHKTLNIHPSLLPKYRGASPIISQILNNEKEIGVTIMQIEETMDTGPVVAQLPSPASRGGVGGEVLGRIELEKILAVEGARLFTHIAPEWIQGVIDPIMQNESLATYCKKVTKEDGRLDIDLDDLSKNALENYLKIKAFEGWPSAYFFLNERRVIITEANFIDNKLQIIKVIPEGKKEMPFEDFLRGLKK